MFMRSLREVSDRLIAITTIVRYSPASTTRARAEASLRWLRALVAASGSELRLDQLCNCCSLFGRLVLAWRSGLERPTTCPEYKSGPATTRYVDRDAGVSPKAAQCFAVRHHAALIFDLENIAIEVHASAFGAFGILIMARPLVISLFDERLSQDSLCIGTRKYAAQRRRQGGLLRGRLRRGLRGARRLIGTATSARGKQNYGRRSRQPCTRPSSRRLRS